MAKHNTRKYNKGRKRNTRRRYRKHGGYDIENYGPKYRSFFSKKSENLSSKLPHMSSELPQLSKKSITHHLQNVGTHAKNIAQKAKDTFDGIVNLITPNTEEDKKTFEIHSQPNEAPKALIGGKRKSKRSKTHRRKYKHKKGKTHRRR